jgi:hypothetical protein
MSASVVVTRHRLSEPGAVITAVAVTENADVWAVVTDPDGSAVYRCRRPGGSTGLAALHTTMVHRSDSILTAVSNATTDSIWVADPGGNRVVRIDHTGVCQTVRSTHQDGRPIDVVGLHDGTAWFTEPDLNSISRIDLMGRVSSFEPGPAGSSPTRIVAVGDSLWVVGPGIAGAWFIRGGDSAPVLHPVDGAADRGAVIASDGAGAVWIAFAAADGHLSDRAQGAGGTPTGWIACLDRRGGTVVSELPQGLGVPLAIAGRPDGGSVVAGTNGVVSVAVAVAAKVEAGTASNRADLVIDPVAEEPVAGEPELVIVPIELVTDTRSIPVGNGAAGPEFTAVAIGADNTRWIADSAGELIEL